MKKILVAIDGSPGANEALRHAAELAKKTNASLLLLQVVDLTAFVVPGVVPPAMASAKYVIATQDLLKQAAEETVEKAASYCRKRRIKAGKSVRTGRPADEIVKEAKRQKVGLIVVASRGRSAVKAAVLGSVALGVIHQSGKIPVLVVKK